MRFTETVLVYLVLGGCVSTAVYLSAAGATRRAWTFPFSVLAAALFWPLYLPLLLSVPTAAPRKEAEPRETPCDAIGAAIAQVESELDLALSDLDNWAEDVLESEAGRLAELRTTWRAQAAKIRELDALLARQAETERESLNAGPSGAERVRSSEASRRQNLARLRAVRNQAYNDLMGTLAWVRELVSMIHLAKYTGAPASRAEELVAQIAAAVEGISAVTWQRNAFSENDLQHMGA